MQLRHFTITLGLFVHAVLSLAQSPVGSSQVHVLLTDASRQPLFGVTVQLRSWPDTTHTITAISDTTGVALLPLKADASYQVRISAMGYKPVVQGIRPTKSLATYRFTLQTESQTLASVTVTARQPLMRQEDDKMIVNPELIASSSTNAFELLTKTPGLFMDQEGHIYLNSAMPATIYINGREQRMSAEDVATLLRSLPPNSVDRIEVMRTPSARYDASNAGGAVNVVLKKGVKIGRTGSVSANMNQGQLGNQGVGFSLNDSDGKRNSYLNLNYSRRDNYEQLSSSRELPGNQIISQQAHTRTPGDALFAGYGLGYQLTPTWELNLDGRGNYGYTNSFSDNTTRIRSLENSQLLTQNLNTVQNLGHTGSLTQGLSTRYKLDSLGSELTADLSYSYLSNRSDQQYLTRSPLPSTTDQTGGGDLRSRRNFITAKADWLQKFPHKLTLEAGFKTSNQWFRSQSDYRIGSESMQQLDPARTAAFTYTDAIYSGYLQSTKTLGKFTLKTGLRLEHTAMDGHQQVPTDTTFRVRRTDLFPYVYLSRPVVSIANFPVQLSLIYRQSIARPTYEQLNPAIRYVDPYLYDTGNPALMPQFTQNVEANLNVASLPILAIGQNYTRQLFSTVLYQNPTNPSQAYRTTDNLGQNRETYFRLLLGIPPGGRYFFVVIGQYNHNQYEGLYDGKPIAFNRGSWTLLTYHQLELDKRSTLQVNGFWSIRGQRQFYTLGNFGTLDLSINRKFMQNRLNVTLSVSDLLFTNPNTFMLEQGSVVAQGMRQGDSRRVGLSLRYNFGLKKQRDESPNPFNFDGLNRAN
ncbi:outer membrane beta-barrel protein [Spirosoma sp.]|uniref:outer membrane beta-barrel protein n=1 Tax=Spirosoma sp. TaxID=1899569 RepID=UPI002606A806|nr:outer membrane beta-barrel protein [Spirosoma sp.]MCX6219035.1 TonB-dependent receptor [Spirosoma sp.]